MAAEYSYDAFGQQTQFAGALFQYYGFTGRETDPENGLIYYRARSYDPASGRFLQRDPLRFAAGDLNLYAYVENDPLNWSDPSGETETLSFFVQRKRGANNAIMAIGEVGKGILNIARKLRRLFYVASTIEDWENEGGYVPPIDDPIPDEEPTKPIGAIVKGDGTLEIIWSNGPPGPPPNPGSESPPPLPRVKPDPPLWWKIINLLGGGNDI